MVWNTLHPQKSCISTHLKGAGELQNRDGKEREGYGKISSPLVGRNNTHRIPALTLGSTWSSKRGNPMTRSSCFSFLPTCRYLVPLHRTKHSRSCTRSLARQLLQVRSNPFVPRAGTSKPARLLKKV